MDRIASGLRRFAGLAGMLVLAGMLSACVLSSADRLVGDDEGATPLPASFSMHGYSETDGFYTATDKAPGRFTASGNAYTGGGAGESPLTVRFVPEGTDTYLLQITGNDPGALYGIARIRGGIMALQIVFGDRLEDAVNAAKAAAPEDIAADLVYADGGITVSKRATLDYAAQLIRDGKLPAEPLVAWISDDPSAAPPAKIVPDGEWYRTAD